MSAPVNMVELVKQLPSRPRGRACIVLTHDYAGQKKWAEELANQTDSEHVHLLDLFADNPELGDEIGGFMVPRLFEFLEGRGQAPVLIVSGMEFLKAAWSGLSDAMEQFASYMETWNKSPCLLFVMQHDNAVANRPFRRFRQYIYVVDQKETLAL